MSSKNIQRHKDKCIALTEDLIRDIDEFFAMAPDPRKRCFKVDIAYGPGRNDKILAVQKCESGIMVLVASSYETEWMHVRLGKIVTTEIKDRIDLLLKIVIAMNDQRTARESWVAAIPGYPYHSINQTQL